MHESTSTIDMSDGWNEAAAWYALTLLVEAQGEEGERIMERDDDITAAKAYLDQEREGI